MLSALLLLARYAGLVFFKGVKEVEAAPKGWRFFQASLKEMAKKKKGKK